MNIKYIKTFFFVVIFLLASLYLVSAPQVRDLSRATLTGNEKESEIDMDIFINCLRESGAYFYGSYNDPLTVLQKMILQIEDRSDIYVECADETSGQVSFHCQVNQIKVFPTWFFKDHKAEEVISIEKLSEITGCPLDY